MTSMAEGIYAEAAESIVSADRAAAEEVATRALADVHDIGKAIVIAYLKANGFEVTDLGRDVSAETFIARAKEQNADIIGMSALGRPDRRRRLRRGRQRRRQEDGRAAGRLRVVRGRIGPDRRVGVGG